MTVLRTTIDPLSPEFKSNAEAMAEKLAGLDGDYAKVLESGGQKAVARHRKRGKMLARERVEMLLDRDAPS